MTEFCSVIFYSHVVGVRTPGFVKQNNEGFGAVIEVKESTKYFLL